MTTGKTINLDKDFPQIEDVKGVVEINPSFGGTRKDSSHFTKSNLPTGYVYCESSVCENGGVSLTDLFRNLLTQMVRDKRVDDSDSKMCQGYESMGKNQRRGCKVTFVSVKVYIKYKE